MISIILCDIEKPQGDRGQLAAVSVAIFSPLPLGILAFETLETLMFLLAMIWRGASLCLMISDLSFSFWDTR